MDFKYYQPLNQTPPLKHSCFVECVAFLKEISYDEAEEMVLKIVPEWDIFTIGIHDDQIEIVMKELFGELYISNPKDMLISQLSFEGTYLVACDDEDEDIAHITIVKDNTLYDHSPKFLSWTIDYILKVA